jgi:NADH:ubiquinone oxidoreductase subunit H
MDRGFVVVVVVVETGLVGAMIFCSATVTTGLVADSWAHARSKFPLVGQTRHRAQLSTLVPFSGLCFAGRV